MMCETCPLMLVGVLLVSLALTRSLAQIQADCNGNISLPCDNQNKIYRSITWYKVNYTLTNRTGIFRKRDGEIVYYDYIRDPSPIFGEDNSLILPRVMPEDDGIYQCVLWGIIGDKNREIDVRLTVSDCVTPVDLTTVTERQNTAHTTSHLSMHVAELSLTWSLTGFLVFSLVKIILCLISTWVFQVIKTKGFRRKQQRY